MKDVTFLCDCHWNDHIIIWSFDPDEQEPFLTVSIHLEPRGFWGRLWPGLRYILGHGCDYDAWTEMLFDASKAKQMRDLLDEYIRVGYDRGNDNAKSV